MQARCDAARASPGRVVDGRAERRLHRDDRLHARRHCAGLLRLAARQGSALRPASAHSTCCLPAGVRVSLPLLLPPPPPGWRLTCSASAVKAVPMSAGTLSKPAAHAMRPPLAAAAGPYTCAMRSMNSCRQHQRQAAAAATRGRRQAVGQQLARWRACLAARTGRRPAALAPHPTWLAADVQVVGASRCSCSKHGLAQRPERASAVEQQPALHADTHARERGRTAAAV